MPHGLESWVFISLTYPGRGLGSWDSSDMCQKSKSFLSSQIIAEMLQNKTGEKPSSKQHSESRRTRVRYTGGPGGASALQIWAPSSGAALLW